MYCCCSPKEEQKKDEAEKASELTEVITAQPQDDEGVYGSVYPMIEKIIEQSIDKEKNMKDLKGKEIQLT